MYNGSYVFSEHQKKKIKIKVVGERGELSTEKQKKKKIIYDIYIPKGSTKEFFMSL